MAIGRWYTKTGGKVEESFYDDLNLPSLEEVIQICLKFAFDTSSNVKPFTALWVALEFLELFPEKMAPHFADIVENAQLAIKHAKVMRKKEKE